MKLLNYRILLRKEPEGGYTVVVPTLPGCITYGDTIDEAIKMAKEAIGLYIESRENTRRRNTHRGRYPRIHFNDKILCLNFHLLLLNRLLSSLKEKGLFLIGQKAVIVFTTIQSKVKGELICKQRQKNNQALQISRHE